MNFAPVLITRKQVILMDMFLELSQKQILSQRMIQSTEILQMTTTELNDYLNELALENPLIDVSSTPTSGEAQAVSDLYLKMQRKSEWLTTSDHQNRVYNKQEREDMFDSDDYRDSENEDETLPNYLLNQLLHLKLPQEEKNIIEFIVYMLDDRGYLKEAPTALASYLHISEDALQTQLKRIQNLEPAGIAACSLQECLLLQLERQGKSGSIEAAIVRNFLQELARNKLDHIAKALKVSLKAVINAVSEIKKLDPKPGSRFASHERTQYITPDAFILAHDDQLEVITADAGQPSVSINNYYLNLQKSTDDKAVLDYIKKKKTQAEWVQNCLQQRQTTLRRVLEQIVAVQHDFFLYGPMHKKPLRLTDLAEALELHESTISRAMKGKYLQCDLGIYPLSYFLTGSLSTTTANISTSSSAVTPEQAQQAILHIIQNEDKTKPYNDRIIAEKLAETGITISRRTVAKYRDILGIPDKTGRKTWNL